MDTPEHTRGETSTPRILHELREVLDKRHLESTPDGRTVGVIRLIMNEPYDATDPVAFLVPFFPKQTELLGWYQKNKATIDELRREDRHSKHTDRFYLEADVEPYMDSEWLKLSKKITAHLSMGTETANAEVAIKLMYQQANNAYNDALHELARLSLGPSQEETLPTAS